MANNLQVNIQVAPFNEKWEKAEEIIKKICESQSLRNAEIRIEVTGIKCP